MESWVVAVAPIRPSTVKRDHPVAAGAEPSRPSPSDRPPEMLIMKMGTVVPTMLILLCFPAASFGVPAGRLCGAVAPGWPWAHDRRVSLVIGCAAGDLGSMAVWGGS